MNQEAFQSIVKKFETRRKEVSNDIYKNIEKLSSLKSLKEVQVNMLSLRQKLLEDNHDIIEHLTILRKKYRSDRAAEMENISKNLQLRYQPTEKSVVIDGKTAASKEMLEIFENQVEFFSESIKTIDNIIYGIRTRLDIEKAVGL